MYNTVSLPNGIQIVLEEIPFIRSIALGVWVKNGSRNETNTTNGISHFIEHMLFKGTTNRSTKEIADDMDAIGGQLNAYTAKEYTCYYTRTLDTHFDTALDIIADMILNSKFDDQEIIKERNVILEEINMYEDSPDELVHDLLESSIFNNNSLGFSVLGTAKSIETFNSDTFIKYYFENYHPENMVIAVAGNIKKDTVSKKIEQYFGDFKKIEKSKKQMLNAIYTPSLITKEKDIEQVHLSLGFESIKMGTDEAYALSILNTIFGGGMSSRLFQTIREDHGLVYSIYAYNSSYLDTGVFSIYAALNAQSTKQVIELILNEIKSLYTNKITTQQLSKAKEQLKSNYLMSLESSSSRMSGIGKAALMLNKIQSPDEIVSKVDAVNIEMVYNLCDLIFDINKLSISAVGNLKGIHLNEFVANANH